MHSTGKLTVMKKYRVISFTMLAMLIATLAVSCAAKADPAAASQVATVQRGNLNINILASGNLLTAHEENLAFYSAGTVQQVLVKVGDRVQSGQVLAKLDTAPLESALAQSAISVKQAQMNLENAEEPKTNSTGSQVISAPDPLDIEIKELQLQNAKDDLVEAQKKLDKATITSPMAGLVTDVNVVPGDQVSANAVGVRVIDPVNFQTEVLVNETEIYQLSIGTSATVQAVALPAYTFPARISLIAETPTIQSNVVNYKVTVQMDPVDAATVQAQSSGRMPTGISSGRIRQPGVGGQTPNAQAASDNRTFSRQAYAGQQSDNQTASDNRTSTRRSFVGQAPGAAGQNQQVQAAATVPQDFRLREGLTVTVSIIAEQRTDILLVPNKAITSRGGKYYVQLVSAGKAAEKMIQAGITDGQNTEVISGLSEGDQVSTATNITTPTTTTNTQQRGGQSNQIPGVRIP